MREREFKEMVIDEFLSFVDDPRVEGRSKHSLETILVIALMAVICGADGFVAIERFAIAKQAWLSGFLDMSGGVPSHDTIGRVFALLNPKSLAEAFRRWSIRVSPTVTTKVVSSSSVHVDGSRCAAWEALTTRANVSVDARGATPLRFRPRRDCSTFPAAVAFDLSLGDESMRLPLVP